VVAGLMVAAGLVVAGPAPVAEAAACSGTSGVTVVVDFGSLGGGVRTGCAGGDPSNGLAALAAAGHGYTFVPRQPGLVCQIDSRPNPCNFAPTTAYWSYWHASRGGSWGYSTVGAGGYNPPAGSVEGWAFGAGRQPGIAPPAAPAPPPAPKPTTRPAPKPTTQAPARPTTSAPGPGTSVGGARPGRSGTAAGSAPGAATRSASPGRPSRAPSTSAGATATAGTSAASADAAAPSTSDSSSPGEVATEPASSSSRTVGAFSLAVALIAALGLAGFLIARRRRAGPPPL
jgi:hypothetical protein